MRLGELAALHGAGAGSAADLEVTGFAIDHRKVAPGHVFGAFAGSLVNGEDFIPAAIARGAIAVVASPGARVEGALHLADEVPRRAFARLAAAFITPVPATIVAVTGTNGKTSCVEMVRQIWLHGGRPAASIGTLGVIRGAPAHAGAGGAAGAAGTGDGAGGIAGEAATAPAGLTTPDIVTFLATMARLAGEGIDHVAFEASSHGLSQYRNEGLRVCAGAFTNLSRDHLDYHGDMESYFAAKMRLFAEVVDQDGTAVIYADDAYAPRAAQIARARGLAVFEVGRSGADLRLIEAEAGPQGQHVRLVHAGREVAITVPLIGAYQVANALVAAGLALASGTEPDAVFRALAQLRPVRGRLELAAMTGAGAMVYVDYAHTPDGLRAAIAALRPHAAGRIIAVFGAGGDRDPGKRAAMGEAASEGADVVIVTDDNPRGEDPGAIRAAILAGAPGAREIAGRRAAIAAAIVASGAGDIVLIAGKGHEQGQIFGSGEDMVIEPFDDAEVVRACVSAACDAERGA